MSLTPELIEELYKINCRIENCKKYKNDGLPYLGSKRGIADRIYHSIINVLNLTDKIKTNPRFVDLFCGGGSMSVCLASHGEKVLMNDKNQYLVLLLEKILKREIPKDLEYHFFRKDEYNSLREIVEKTKFEDLTPEMQLRCAYALGFWSFGGKFGDSYIYGVDRVQQKELLHNALYNNDMEAKKEVEELLGTEFFIDPSRTPHENYSLFNRKLAKVFNKLREQGNPLQHLSDLTHLTHNGHLYRLPKIKKENIQISSMSYDEVKIEDNDVVYCDPPYENTAKYLNAIDHQKFFEFCMSKPNSVFISEYQDLTKYGFIKIFEVDKRIGLNSYQKTQHKTECLFWNGH